MTNGQKRQSYSVILLLLCLISVSACDAPPLTKTYEDLPPPDRNAPKYLIGPEDEPQGDPSAVYPMERTPKNYLKRSANGHAPPTCPAQVIEDDFGRPTQACLLPTGEAVFLQ